MEWLVVSAGCIFNLDGSLGDAVGASPFNTQPDQHESVDSRPPDLTQLLKLAAFSFYLAIIPALFYSLEMGSSSASAQRAGFWKYTNEF